MDNNADGKSKSIKNIKFFESLKGCIKRVNVSDLYKCSIESFFEKTKESNIDINHIICKNVYEEVVYFFYTNVIDEKHEFLASILDDDAYNKKNKLEDIKENIKKNKSSYYEKLNKLKNIILENIENCQKCLMVYYVLQKKFIENISSVIKNDENLISIIKNELFKINFYRVINKIVCPVNSNKVYSIILELMLNGSKIFQVDNDYQLDINKINKENMKLFIENFLKLDDKNIYNIIKKYTNDESLYFFCGILYKEFKTSKKLLIEINESLYNKDECNKNEKNDDDVCIISENLGYNSNNKKLEQGTTIKNAKNEKKYINIFPYIYSHIFLLLKHTAVEDGIKKVLKEKIILYSLMLNSLRYSDNFIQLIIFKIIHNTFINDEIFFSNDATKKLISSIFLYWIKLSDGCIIKMINSNLSEENTYSNKPKKEDNFLKNSIRDYDIFKYMQCLLCGIYLLFHIKKKKVHIIDNGENSRRSNSNNDSKTKTPSNILKNEDNKNTGYILDEESTKSFHLNKFITSNESNTYLIWILFQDHMEIINNLLNLSFKVLYFLNHFKLYIAKNANIKNKYFELASTYSCINIIYNILDMNKKSYIHSFEVDEYTKNLYKKKLKENCVIFENIAIYSLSPLIYSKDYYIRLFSIKVLSIILSDSNIRDSLEKNIIFGIFDSLVNIEFSNDKLQKNEEKLVVNNLLLHIFKANIKENAYSNKLTNIIFSDKKNGIIKYLVHVCDDDFNLIELKHIFEHFFVLFIKIINIVINRVEQVLPIEKYKDLFMNIYSVIEVFMNELKKEKNKKLILFFLPQTIYLCHLISNGIYKAKVHSAISFLTYVFNTIKSIESSLSSIYDDLINLNHLYEEIYDEEICYSSDDDKKETKDINILYFYNKIYNIELEEKSKNTKDVNHGGSIGNNTNIPNGKTNIINITGCSNKDDNKKNKDDMTKNNKFDHLQKLIKKCEKYRNIRIMKNKENDKMIYKYINCFFFLCVSNTNKKTKKNIIKAFDLIIKYIMKDEYKMNRSKNKSKILTLPLIIIKDMENEEKRYNLIIGPYDYILKCYIMDLFKCKKYLVLFLLSILNFTNTMILFLKRKDFIDSSTNEKLNILDCFILINSKVWFYLNATIKCLIKYMDRNNCDSILLRIINLIIDNIWKIIIYIFYSVKIKDFAIKIKTCGINVYVRDALLLFLKFYSTWMLFIKKFAKAEKYRSLSNILPDLFFKKLSFLSSQILNFFQFIESNMCLITDNETNIFLLSKQKEIINTILESLIYLIKMKEPNSYESCLNNIMQYKLKLKTLQLPQCVHEILTMWEYKNIFNKTKEILLNQIQGNDLSLRNKLEEEGDSLKISKLNIQKKGKLKKIIVKLLKCKEVNDLSQKDERAFHVSNSKKHDIKEHTFPNYEQDKSRSDIKSNLTCSNEMLKNNGIAKENTENETGRKEDTTSGVLKKEEALEKAKKILEKNASLKTQKRAIILNEKNSEINKHQYFKEMREKRVELENTINKYYIMLQEFLEWDFYDLENLDKYKNCINEEVPTRFKNEDEYHKFFKPMVLEECRCSILNKMVGDTYKFVINVIGKKKTPYWLIWNISASNENKTNLDNLKPMDLIVLVPYDDGNDNLRNGDNGDIRYDELKEIMKSQKHILGLVDVASNKTENIYDIKLINEDNFPLKTEKRKNRLNLNYITNNKYHAYFICSLITNIREFQSVYGSKSSPLFNIILDPVESNNKDIPEKKHGYKNINQNRDKIVSEKKENLNNYERFILQNMKRYNILNESQIDAVKLVFLNKNGISLIQGPPGTGKTKTVIGIISALYALMNDNNSVLKNGKQVNTKEVVYNNEGNGNNKKKILVCSPSNSAIDEIAKRILNDGLMNFMRGNNSKKNSNNSSDDSDILDDNNDNYINKKYNKKGGTLFTDKNRDNKYHKTPYLKKQTIIPKCIRIGLSKKTDKEIQPISLDYIFNKRKNSKQNAYEDHFNNRKNSISFSLKAIGFTLNKMKEVRDKLNYNSSKKYCVDANDTKYNKESCEQVENINNFFSEEIINNVDEKYLEKLLYLFNESHSHYEWSFDKLNSENKTFEERKKILIEADKEVGAFYSNINKDNMVLESDVIFSTLSGSASPILENIEFEYLIIDEACQCVELSCLIPFRLKVKSIIMVGDPKQLPATVFSEDCKKYGYSRSLFERLLLCKIPSVLLNVQYRMRPEICYFPNKYFYNGLIKNDESLMNKPLFYLHYLNILGCYKFINIQGIESITHHKSYINYAEAYFIFRLIVHIQNMMENKDNASPIPRCYKLSINFNLKDIGIICPYQSQVHLIRKLFENNFPDNEYPEVSTVDAFQGREKNIIIFSCVRSYLQAMECLKNNNETNTYKNKKNKYFDTKNLDDDDSDDLHKIKWINNNENSNSISNKNKFKTIQKYGNNIGFLKDERRLNVALTRAKDSLWIIGDKTNLQKNSTWDSLIKNAIARNCYVDLNLNFDRSTKDKNIEDIINNFFLKMDNMTKDDQDWKNDENDVNNDTNSEIFNSSNSEYSIKRNKKNNGYYGKEKTHQKSSDENDNMKNKHKYKSQMKLNHKHEREFSFSRVYIGNQNYEKGQQSDKLIKDDLYFERKNGNKRRAADDFNEFDEGNMIFKKMRHY
ncbi:conserved Plasmodium protein, unknown function [Plasmodium vinckei vinckei]|uniref:Helicase ATP-binding domain-containing protein n=1 Tax=Plasmodium vinckei vinckei TaxID=54757 RepID=A0A449BZB7_PLAVN|nr:conserved Plasmodium protein, unknown function [Plasmodium vinckei vinckei]VEV58786.1 conserved Plasmodium protein, unknown function [Plasmodium vinckei vinckei]